MEVRHLYEGQLGSVEDLSAGDSETVVLALECNQRRCRGRTGLRGEHRRRRIIEATYAERSIDESDGAVGTRDAPVAFTHMTDEYRVEFVVHCVHLAEVCIANQGVARADECRGVGVALGAVAVAIGHHVRGGK